MLLPHRGMGGFSPSRRSCPTGDEPCIRHTGISALPTSHSLRYRPTVGPALPQISRSSINEPWACVSSITMAAGSRFLRFIRNRSSRTFAK